MKQYETINVYLWSKNRSIQIARLKSWRAMIAPLSTPCTPLDVSYDWRGLTDSDAFAKWQANLLKTIVRFCVDVFALPAHMICKQWRYCSLIRTVNKWERIHQMLPRWRRMGKSAHNIDIAVIRLAINYSMFLKSKPNRTLFKHPHAMKSSTDIRNYSFFCFQFLFWLFASGAFNSVLHINIGND